MPHRARRPEEARQLDRLRRGIGALVAGVAALVLQGDLELFHIGVALALALLVFELLGRALSRWTPSKDPDDYRS